MKTVDDNALGVQGSRFPILCHERLGVQFPGPTRLRQAQSGSGCTQYQMSDMAFCFTPELQTLKEPSVDWCRLVEEFRKP